MSKLPLSNSVAYKFPPYQFLPSKSLLLNSFPRLLASFALAGCVVTHAGVASSAAADLSAAPWLRHQPPATITAVTKPPVPKRVARTPARARPDPALLAQPGTPDCGFNGTFSIPPTPEETRQKLDYEAQCYRQAEALVRARLEALQEAVRQMLAATASRATLASANE
jgi:hypothetical protein